MSRAPIRELLLGAAIAGVVFACSPGPSMQRAAEPAPPPQDPRIGEIQTRMQDIRNWRQKLDMRIEPPEALVREASSRHGNLKLMCPDNESDADECTQTCGLAQDICDNAKAICDDADLLKGNAWARSECDSANASCTEASKKCCECNDQHSDADAAGTW